MKKNIISLLLTAICCSVALSAKDVVINKPHFDFSNTGIENLTKIELNERETRVHILITFLPDWKINFRNNIFLQDCATGKKYYVTGLEGGELEQEITMPPSGKLSFVLKFPPLDKSVTKVHYSKDEEGYHASIYGISLNPKDKYNPKNDIPANVQKWLDEKLTAAKRKTPMDFDKGEFFARDTTRLVGYIKGYDPRADFSSGMIYIDNDITREDFPTVIKIEPDGRFEVEVPLFYPIIQYFVFERYSFQRFYMNVYLEPGATVVMILDWEDFLKSDRYRKDFDETDIQFCGSLADINKEMVQFKAKLPSLPYGEVYNQIDKKTPTDFLLFYDSLMSDYHTTYQRLLDTEKLSPKARHLLENDKKMTYAQYLWEYESNYRYEHTEALPLSFYNFLHNVPMTDKTILATKSFGLCINRLEYCNLFMQATNEVYKLLYAQKTFKEYLFEDLGLKPSVEDEKYYQTVDTFNIKRNLPEVSKAEKDSLLKEYEKLYEPYWERHKKQAEDYQAKYIDVLPKMSDIDIEIEQRRRIDSVYTDVLKLPHSIVQDIIKSRSMNYLFRERYKNDREKALNYLVEIAITIKEPFIRKEAERLFLLNFPAGGKQAYTLPNTPAAQAFEEIIAPFKGKIVLVDFWAIWCGPCVSNIKHQQNLRKEFKDNPDVAFVFITDGSTPLERYNQFVDEQDLTHSFRVSDEQYLYFRELFRFSGIPRYILVNKEGKIIDDNASGHNAKSIIEEALKN